MLEKQFLLLPKQTLMMMTIFLLKLPTSCADNLITTLQNLLTFSFVYKIFYKKFRGLLLIFPQRPWTMEIHFALSLKHIDKLCLEIYFSTIWLKQDKNIVWKMPIPLSKVIYRLSIYFQFMLCQANNHQKKKLKRSILFECIYSKCFFVLKQGYSSHLNKEKICLFCHTCFCTLLDCFSRSVIFFDLEKFYNAKLKSSTECFNWIVENSQPHLLYSPSWVRSCMDLDSLTMSITNKPFFLSVNC